MRKSIFQKHLEANAESAVRFVLPDGTNISAHAHVTEVGRVEKRFIDCGGTQRSWVTTNLQTWVEDDVDHRLLAGKLARGIDLAAPLFGAEDPEVEIEHEASVISQSPVECADAAQGLITFRLATKHTDCLAKDSCIPATAEDACGEGSSCC